MKGKRLIRTIRLDNILSYGSWEEEFHLEPLNVFIGPNASGKSNLIEVLSLLAAPTRDLQAPIREGGGVHEWLWKGATRLGTAIVDVTDRISEGTAAQVSTVVHRDWRTVRTRGGNNRA